VKINLESLCEVLLGGAGHRGQDTSDLTGVSSFEPADTNPGPRCHPGSEGTKVLGPAIDFCGGPSPGTLQRDRARRAL
jgi:hypothetical protein